MLIATVLLHVLVIYWASEHVSLPAHQDQAEKTVEISLSPRPLETGMQQPVARADKTETPPAAPARPRSRPVAPAVPVTAPAALSNPDSSAAEETSPAEIAALTAPLEIKEASPEKAAAMAETPASPASEEKPATAKAPEYVVLPPPSARLTLELSNTKPGQPNPYLGEGEINWEAGDGKYKMSMKAGLKILFASVNLLTMRSEGLLDSHGIAPVLSSETRRGRSETATHFNREEKTISFSASTKTAVLSDGAQDKNTILMQLAGIGNADARQMQAGREFAIQIGEDRDATVFQFVVQGQEKITTKLGNLTTWHLVRPPRPGSYNSRLDVWLAPELHWYPVQIRNTESNGAVTTQSVTKITQITNQGH
ncbi:DUF3108 domain-containing protein [Undibacterium terreum]|uniref:DUF3108 domain-containing protein n=1 Tax=Undibacterium terreum TaxID=1224302 RepID=A0A916UVB8_9BURK|nr:DUF3108 domain-containing protein [Undibacterium terreum]GGC88460.1 hypothetical protein GCM10011396_39570 [Undibacterium terreum]